MDQYNAWIGLKSVKGTWQWLDGYPYYYIDWAPEEPEEGDQCASVHHSSSSSRRIYGNTCEEHYFFYCSRVRTSILFIPLSKTWAEAREYCTEHYTDLVAYPYMYFTSTQNFPVWVGLPSDGLSGVNQEPSGNCSSISSNQKNLTNQICSNHFPFLCADDNVLLVREEKSWEEALEHCRGLSTANSSYDLVSVQPGEDHHYMMTKVPMANTEEVWVGLRFLAGIWFWVDGADVSYPDLLQCPLKWKHCGALTRTSFSRAEARDCEEKKNFLCYSLPPDEDEPSES